MRRYSREHAHDQVKAVPKSIYVEAAGRTAYLEAVTREGVNYVRTHRDDTPIDNLLQVKEC